MKELTALWLLILLSPSLFGQTAPSSLIPGSEKTQLQEKEMIAALNSVQKYCWTAESFSKSHEPRLFAEIHSDANQIAEWVELSNRAEWLRVGKPKPIAWVWYKDGSVIQVAMAFDKRDENGPLYADYCYQKDGKLARLAPVPTMQTTCDDAYFRCQLTFGIEWLYLPNGQKVPIIHGMDSRFLKSEETSFSRSKLTPPEYLNVSDLPFAHLLR
jgi:hypothetical protein